jgi:hypothetical protein
MVDASVSAPLDDGGGGNCTLIRPQAKAAAAGGPAASPPSSYDLFVFDTLVPSTPSASAGKFESVGLTSSKGDNQVEVLTLSGTVAKGNLGLPTELVAMDVSTNPARTLTPINTLGNEKRCMSPKAANPAAFKCLYNVAANKLTADSKLSIFLFFPKAVTLFNNKPIVIKDYATSAPDPKLVCTPPQTISADGKSCVDPSGPVACVAPTPVRLFDQSCGTAEQCGANALVDTTMNKCICKNGFVFNKQSGSCLSANPAFNQLPAEQTSSNCSLQGGAAGNAWAAMAMALATLGLLATFRARPISTHRRPRK